MSVQGRIDLVVSHNQEASAAALRIVEVVEAHGYSAWADVKTYYSPLESPEKQIALAFSAARVICLFVGGGYRDTRWCHEEVGLGLQTEQDLGIDRVITIHDGEPGRLLIPSSLAHKPTFAFTDTGCEGLVEYLSRLPDHSAALEQWTRSGPGARAGLLGRLPVDERIKLVVEHVECLTNRFTEGRFDRGSHKHAMLLGLVGPHPNQLPTHLSPSALMEMSWRWVVDILGDSTVRRLTSAEAQSEEGGVGIETTLPLVRLPALFLQCLSVVRERRSPRTNTKDELLSAVDYVLRGFALLCARTGADVDQVFGEMDRLLALFAGSDPRVARTARFLRENLPEIAYPENDIRRQIAIYNSLKERDIDAQTAE